MMVKTSFANPCSTPSGVASILAGSALASSRRSTSSAPPSGCAPRSFDASSANPYRRERVGRSGAPHRDAQCRIRDGGLRIYRSYITRNVLARNQVRASDQYWRRGTLHHSLSHEQLVEHARGGLRQFGGFVAQYSFRMDLALKPAKMLPAGLATPAQLVVLRQRWHVRRRHQKAHLDPPPDPRHRLLKCLCALLERRAERNVV